MDRFIISWLVVGAGSTLFAIYIFRRDGQSKRKGELYFVFLGILLGWVTWILLVLDLVSSMRECVYNMFTKKKGEGWIDGEGKKEDRWL